MMWIALLAVVVATTLAWACRRRFALARCVAVLLVVDGAVECAGEALNLGSDPGVVTLFIVMLGAGAASSGALAAFAIERRRPLELVAALCWIFPWVFEAANFVWLAGLLLDKPGFSQPPDLGVRGVGFAALGAGVLAWSAGRRAPRTRSSIAWRVLVGGFAVLWGVATAKLLMIPVGERAQLDTWRGLGAVGYAGTRVALAVLLWRSIVEPIPRARIHAA